VKICDKCLSQPLSSSKLVVQSHSLEQHAGSETDSGHKQCCGRADLGGTAGLAGTGGCRSTTATGTATAGAVAAGGTIGAGGAIGTGCLSGCLEGTEGLVSSGVQSEDHSVHAVRSAVDDLLAVEPGGVRVVDRNGVVEDLARIADWHEAGVNGSRIQRRAGAGEAGLGNGVVLRDELEDKGVACGGVDARRVKVETSVTNLDDEVGGKNTGNGEESSSDGRETHFYSS